MCVSQELPCCVAILYSQSNQIITLLQISMSSEFSIVTCFLSLISPTIVHQHQPRGFASTNHFWSLDSGSTFSSQRTLWFPLRIQMLQAMFLEKEQQKAAQRISVHRFTAQRNTYAAIRWRCHSALLQRTVPLSPSSLGFTAGEE